MMTETTPKSATSKIDLFPIRTATHVCRQSLQGFANQSSLRKDHWAENRFIAFNLWVSGVGACANAANCLDKRLEHDISAQKVVMGVLNTLAAWSTKCIELAEALESTIESLHDQPGIESIPTNVGSLSTHKQSTDPIYYEDLDNVKKAVEALLNALVDLEIAIRRAGTASRVRRADRSFNKRKDDYMELEEHLEFIMRVSMAPRQKDSSEDQRSPNEIDVNSTLSQIQIEKAPLRPEQQLLVRANIKRHHRFLFYKGRQKQLRSEQNPPNPSQTIRVDVVPTIARTSDAPITREDHHERPLKGLTKQTARSQQSIGTTNQASSYVPVPLLGEAEKVVSPGIAASAIALRADYPKPPRDKSKCPYCLVPLKGEANDVRLWKNHAAEDLQPYSCYLLNCSQDHPFFGNFESWKAHVLSKNYHQHFEGWSCLFCGFFFGSLEKPVFIDHVQENHPNGVAKESLTDFANLCCRYTAPALEICPVCSTQEIDWKLRRDCDPKYDPDVKSFLEHLGQCMHNFALRVLPGTDPVEPDDEFSQKLTTVSCLEDRSWPSCSLHVSHHTRDGLTETDLKPFSPLASLDQSDVFEMTHTWVEFAENMSDPNSQAVEWTPDPLVVQASMVPALREKPPRSTIPIPRDVKFVGRQDVLRALELRFSQTNRHHRVVLAGLGGVGKSQIAIEYSYRHRERDPDSWVFWVYASTAERFEGSYRSIAATLDLPGADDPNPKTDVLDLVSRWLSNVDNGRWLMILDNADDVDVFRKTRDGSAKENSPNLPLSSYIPQPVTGSVLVTTRDRGAISWLSTGLTSVIPVNLMELEEAEQLLRINIPEDISDTSDCAELVKELDLLPLAISQAAAYISANPDLLSVSEYLMLYRQSEESQSRLLDKDSGDLRRDPGVPNSVIRTWQISFDLIKRNQPQAAELLSLMVMLDRQGIPEFLLNVQYPDSLDLKDALSPLNRFSLITIKEGGKTFGMHRLVQLATRKWVEKYGDSERWWGQAIGVVSKSFPDGSYTSWKTCKILLPHALQVLTYELEASQSIIDRALLLHNMARYNRALGRYEVARAENRQALEIREEVLGKTHPDTLATMSNLAGVLDSQGKYADAEAMNRQTLAIQEQVLGKTHPDTLTSMSNLAQVLSSQGKYAYAETMNRQTLEIREEVLGNTHPDTLMTMNNLALVLFNQGKYADAEAMNRQTLAIKEEVLGKTHPDTLTTMSNLAQVLSRQGKYADAEAMNRQTLAIREEVLGKTHPDTLTSVYCLAYLLENRHEYEDASILYQRARTGFELSLGPEHPTTKACVNHYSEMLQSLEEAK